MRKLTIEITNNEDASLLLKLVERLGLRISHDSVEKETKKNLAYYQEIVRRGGGMTEEELNDILRSLEADRKDRDLPFDEL